MTSWSRSQLCEWVRGKHLYARDGQAANAAAPEWLVEASAGLGPAEDSAEVMERTYPDDRNVVITTFIDALDRPGEVASGRIRAQDIEVHGRWTTVQIEWLNLIDDPDVGCLLCAMVEVGAGALPAPLLGQTGAFENTRWMVLELQASGVIRSVDGKVREIIGRQPDELVGRHLGEFIHPDALADGVANWVAMVATVGGTSTARRPWLTKDGGHVWLEGSYLNRGHDSVLAVVWDIAGKLKQEQELADLTAQFQVLADEVPAAVFRCDLEGNVLFHNARWASLVEGRPAFTRLHDLVADQDRDRLSASFAALAADQQGERRAIDVASGDGTAVWRVALRPTGELGTGRVTVVGSVEDVTASVRWQSEARHDALTGVLNRHGLDEVLAELADPSTVVVFIDLDRFKPVNDEFGYDAGDAVLVEVARRLAAVAQPGDVVGRFGGDEFVVVCHGVAPGEDAAEVRRFEEALAGPVFFEGGQWQVTASVGAARHGEVDDLRSVVRRADHAMLDVKREHRLTRGAPAGR